MEAHPTLSIVMPVFNEKATIGEILIRVQKVGIDKEILVVDDGSTDGTREFLENLSSHPIPTDHLRVFFQKENQGKGAAFRRALKEARGDIVLVQDADLEYDPEEILRVIQPIVEGEAKVVYGSRLKYSQKHKYASWSFYLGGRLVTLTTNFLFGGRLTDEPTGYKAFQTDLLRQFEIENNDFAWEPEITAKILEAGVPIQEVPISYSPRPPKEKKINWRDGLKALWTLLRYRVQFWFVPYRKTTFSVSRLQ